MIRFPPQSSHSADHREVTTLADKQPSWPTQHALPSSQPYSFLTSLDNASTLNFFTKTKR